MTNNCIFVYGNIDKKNGEEWYFSDEYYPSIDYVKKTIYQVIDELSKEGFVDVDVEYGHRNRKDNTRIYTIEFFVDDTFRGYMSIVV